MDQKSTFPVFAKPPNEYNRQYFDDLTRSLNQLVFLMRTPGVGRNTTITLTDIPTSGYGLEPGALFRQGNTVKIVLEYEAYPTGVQAQSSVGTVTVTTV